MFVILRVIKLSAVIVADVMPNVVMLRIIMLNGIMLNVVMLNVVAPKNRMTKKTFFRRAEFWETLTAKYELLRFIDCCRQ